MDVNKAFSDFSSKLEDALHFGPRKLVGVDIGASSIKICELSVSKKKWVIEKFSLIPLPEGSIVDDEIHKPDDLKESLKKAIEQAKIKNKYISFGLFGPNTIAKRIQVSNDNPAELDNEVYFESEQYIPFGIDDSALSYDVITQSTTGTVDVVVAAAREDLMENYKQIFVDLGLKVKVVDLNILALANVFEFVAEDVVKGPRNSVIIEFGAQTTKVVVFKAGSLIFTRELNIGGNLITEEIQKSMGINYVEAEDLKTLGDESGNYPEEILNIINENLDSFIGEIRKVLSFFLTASQEEKIDRMYITGGAAQTPGLLQIMETSFECKVELLDIFQKVETKKSFNEQALEIIRTHATVVLGLAAREG